MELGPQHFGGVVDLYFGFRQGLRVWKGRVHLLFRSNLPFGKVQLKGATLAIMVELVSSIRLELRPGLGRSARGELSQVFVVQLGGADRQGTLEGFW